MFRKRGAPVFLELMRGPGVHGPGMRAPAPAAPRPSPSAPAPLFDREKMSEQGPRAVAVETKPPPPPAPAKSLAAPAAPVPVSGPTASTLRRRGRELLGLDVNPWVLVAGLLGVALVVWMIAYSLGHWAAARDAEVKKQQWMTRIVPENDPMSQQGQSGSSPGDKSLGSSVKTPSPKLPSDAGNSASKLEKGMNYLVVATLMKKDADDAAAYLGSVGLPAALIPSKKGVDPASAEANNIQWKVVVLQGYASDDFRKSYSERKALATQAEALGRKWKAQSKKAPTDFSQGFWAKYEG